MLASINWLKQYVDITLSPEDLAEKLTRAGLEVEQVIHLGKGLEGVITGKVAQIERHPNSDHLWVCRWIWARENWYRFSLVPRT